jgi:acetoin utilization deacetylase AcuC-like enzyme
MKTLIVNDERFLNHLTGAGHPESPKRIMAIQKRLIKDKLLSESNVLAPRMAKFDELALCHSAKYINLVESEVNALGNNEVQMLSTGDAPICHDSFKTAKLAVGGILEAVDAVFTGKARNVFCAVRPPGHHASQEKGEGFCLFNNAAIGARYAQKTYGIKNVLIIDWDVHHGNGTQRIFENDPSVFYFSTHQHPSYPGTGQADEKGVGNIRNFPITYGIGAREIILKLVKNDLKKEMAGFKPELIIVSAGFDSREDDPLGMFNLKDEDFAALTREAMEIAEKHCGGRLISVLEGGYNTEGLAAAVSAHVKELASH